MQYKGDDLDLRVPGSRPLREPYATDYDQPITNGRWPRTSGYGTGLHEPLWVDETVLGCCNYAYDIAMANGAGEVGLEHLVNALTRVEAAARMLEARGVREGQLRRESASLIASEIPITGSTERNPPRRSPDFEDVLRRAVEQASRRGVAASVDDVLWVILHYGRDLPAVQLLRRHTPDWQRPDWARVREMAAPASDQRLAQQPLQIQPQPAYGAIDALAGRMANMEDGLRTLHLELTSERKGLADLIRDTQRDIVAGRGDGAALRNDLAQRLEGLERGLHSRPDGGRMAQQLTERMQALEKLIVTGLQSRPDDNRQTAQLSERVQSLEKAVHSGLGEGARNWAALGQRLQSLETSLITVTTPGGQTGADLKPLLEQIAKLEQGLETRLTQNMRVASGLAERLQVMERLIEAGTGEGGRNWASLTEKLGTLETTLRTRQQGAGPELGELVNRMGALEAAVRSRPQNAGPAPEFAEFVERFSGLERAVRAGFGESLRTTSVISDRLAVVEKAATAATSGGDDEGLLMIDDRIQSIERLLQDQATGRVDPGKFDLTELAAPITRRLTAIEEQSGERARNLEGLLRETVNRIATLDQRVASGASVHDEATRGRDREVAEMHEAIVRLSENQHTLASAIADWRHESHNDLGAVNAQLERMSAGPAITTAAADIATSDFPSFARAGTRAPASSRPVVVDSSNTTYVADAPGVSLDEVPQSQRGRGFWWWLFGTGNVGQANRDAEIRWKRMHDRIKETRDRRRA